MYEKPKFGLIVYNMQTTIPVWLLENLVDLFMHKKYFIHKIIVIMSSKLLGLTEVIIIERQSKKIKKGPKTTYSN